MKSHSRNPILAVVLSLFAPGLGQLYAGRVARALAIVTIGLLGIFVLGIFLRSGDMLRILSVEIFFGSLFSIVVCVDAWIIAKKTDPAYEPDERNRIATYGWFIGLILASSIVVAMYEAKRLQEYARTYKMVGKSMNPALSEGDVIFVDHDPYLQEDPGPGELVIYRSPKNRAQQWTSRVVATAGQTVEIRKGTLFIDGDPVPTETDPDGNRSERFGGHSYRVLGMDELPDFGPVTVPDFHTFLLCDNRSNSIDSRHFGPVGIGSIHGRAKFRYWPREKAGPINQPDPS